MNANKQTPEWNHDTQTASFSANESTQQRGLIPPLAGVFAFAAPQWKLSPKLVQQSLPAAQKSKVAGSGWSEEAIMGTTQKVEPFWCLLCIQQRWRSEKPVAANLGTT